MMRNAPEMLVRWALLGLLALLCAPWLAPSNKLYHQLLIVLLWLPALICLGHAVLRPRLPWPASGFSKGGCCCPCWLQVLAQGCPGSASMDSKACRCRDV